QMLSPKVFDLMHDLKPKFPIMDFYLSNAENQIINSFVPKDFKMMDVGKLDVLDDAEQFVNQ
ncbi:MAG TPA: nucleotidyltransferase family protein, partial [Paludibacter sp.]